MLRRTHSSIQQFEIKLENNTGYDDDVILLSGIPIEAASSPLRGTLIFTTMEHTRIKNITLKLRGDLRLYFNDHNSSKQSSTLPLRFEKCLYEDTFDKFEIPGRLISNSFSKSNKSTPVSSLTNLSSYFGVGKKHSQSSKNLDQLSSLSPLTNSTSSTNLSSSSHQLSSGTYKFPFELIIPGSAHESIESNIHAQMSYTLTATVSKGLGQQNIVARKKVYIVRTLGVDNYDVAHTVSVDNTWPKKVDYSIRVPCKAAPFGSQLEVQFTIVPLAKGLKLGDIRTEIQEYVTMTPPNCEKKEEIHTVSRQNFDVPENFDHMSDVWQLLHRVKLPKSLSVCSQDADIDPYVKINHKFACVVSLINSDGHRSELRASLPITLYISPHVNIFHSTKPITHKLHGHARTSSKSERPLFGAEHSSNTNLARLPDLRSVQDFAAPPNYRRSAQDKILSTDTTPISTPPLSRPASPGVSLSPSHNHLSTLDQSQQAQLANGLRQLVMTRNNPGTLSSPSSQLSLAALSRVPSYEEALNERTIAEAAPEYSD